MSAITVGRRVTFPETVLKRTAKGATTGPTPRATSVVRQATFNATALQIVENATAVVNLVTLPEIAQSPSQLTVVLGILSATDAAKKAILPVIAPVKNKPAIAVVRLGI